MGNFFHGGLNVYIKWPLNLKVKEGGCFGSRVVKIARFLITESFLGFQWVRILLMKNLVWEILSVRSLKVGDFLRPLQFLP